MSDRGPHACIYCAIADGGCYRDIGTGGFFWCHQSCREGINPNRTAAEYAALALAHDASITEYERVIGFCDIAWDEDCKARRGMYQKAIDRADAAEAQLAAAREDGARSMAAWLAERQALHFFAIVGRHAVPAYESDHLTAAWRAAQALTPDDAL